MVNFHCREKEANIYLGCYVKKDSRFNHFFFSSRRRHTRWPRDWSSDGALPIFYDVERFDDAAGCKNPEIADLPDPTDDPFDEASCASGLIDFDNVDFAQRAVDGNNESYATIYAEIGRASCRESE